MSYTKCVYHECKNKSLSISMFRFPVKDRERSELWKRNSGNPLLDHLTNEELRCRYICAAHFLPSDIGIGLVKCRLLGPAVPIHFQCADIGEGSVQKESGDADKEIDHFEPKLRRSAMPKQYTSDTSDTVQLPKITAISIRDVKIELKPDPEDATPEDEQFSTKQELEKEVPRISTISTRGVKVEIKPDPDEDPLKEQVDTEREIKKKPDPRISEISTRGFKVEIKPDPDEDSLKEQVDTEQEIKKKPDESEPAGFDEPEHATSDGSPKYQSELLLDEYLRKKHNFTINEDTLNPDVYGTTETYICDFCNKEFKFKSELLCHHKFGCRKYVNKNKIQNKIITSYHRCKKCNLHFDSKKGLLIHQRNHVNLKVKRKELYTFSSKTSHDKFIGKNIYNCKMCDQTFATNTDLLAHELIHATEKSYHCEVCNTHYPNEKAYVAHEKTHADFKCDFCEESFTAKHSLVHHRLIHKTSPYPCKLCDRKFAFKANLVNHERSHPAGRSCKICCKEFENLYLLNDHERMHNGGKPFVYKTVFEKPYSCDLCKVVFSHKSNLDQHMRECHYYIRLREDNTIPTPIVKFTDKSETLPVQKTNLTYTKNLDTKIICELCKKQFRKQSNLVQHMKLLHSL